jgi:hypothetical protein
MRTLLYVARFSHSFSGGKRLFFLLRAEYFFFNEVHDMTPKGKRGNTKPRNGPRPTVRSGTGKDLHSMVLEAEGAVNKPKRAKK